MKLCRFVVIDAKNKKITVEERPKKESLEFMQGCVGGYIERGMDLENGDELFIDEEGLFKGYDFGFSINGSRFVGSGVLSASTKTGDTASAKSEVQSLQSEVEFFSIVEQGD